MLLLLLSPVLLVFDSKHDTGEASEAGKHRMVARSSAPASQPADAAAANPEPAESIALANKPWLGHWHANCLCLALLLSADGCFLREDPVLLSRSTDTGTAKHWHSQSANAAQLS